MHALPRHACTLSSPIRPSVASFQQFFSFKGQAWQLQNSNVSYLCTRSCWLPLTRTMSAAPLALCRLSHTCCHNASLQHFTVKQAVLPSRVSIGGRIDLQVTHV